MYKVKYVPAYIIDELSSEISMPVESNGGDIVYLRFWREPLEASFSNLIPQPIYLLLLSEMGVAVLSISA